METLINVQPTDILRRSNSLLFYYGVKDGRVYLLPAHAEFSVVHSPVEQHGWEFVRYRVLEEINGYAVVERRSLSADEIAYFEQLSDVKR